MFGWRGITDSPGTTLLALAMLLGTFLLYTRSLDVGALAPLLEKLGGLEAVLGTGGSLLLALYRGKTPARRRRHG